MDYRTENRFSNGTFQRLLLSSMSLLIGSSLVLLSLRVLKSPELQMDHYLSLLISRHRPIIAPSFPLSLLTSVLLSMTWGIAQIIFSLMFFFNELGWRSWCWANVATFLSCALNLLQIIDPISEHGGQSPPLSLQLQLPPLGSPCGAYHTLLIINTGFSVISLMHSVFMTSLNLKNLHHHQTNHF